MNRSVIKRVAKQNGVSVAEVRREIQIALGTAYANPSPAALAVPRKGSVPTPEEFVAHCVREIVSQSAERTSLHDADATKTN